MEIIIKALNDSYKSEEQKTQEAVNKYNQSKEGLKTHS